MHKILRKSFTGIVFAAAVLLLAVPYARAQENFLEHINFSAGAGFTMPVNDAGNDLDPGWNLNFRGGLSVTHQLMADLDFTYVNSGFNSSTLARLGEPNGGVGTWSLTFNPVVRFATRETRFQPYVTAGYGLYHSNFTLTQPASVPTVLCDPFFGTCFPGTVGVNQVVASNSTYKAGFNGGLGFDIPLSHPGVKLFMEARYHRMFVTHGSDIEYIPVTFGVRW